MSRPAGRYSPAPPIRSSAAGVLLVIPDLLDAMQLAEARAVLGAAEWVDGGATAGEQSRLVKRNRQLPEGSAAARAIGDIVLGALGGNAAFVSAALPLRIFPPLFNRYGVGDGFGTHVDNAIRAAPGSAVRLRTDLSATLFLSEPGDYDGGELVVEGAGGAQPVKLAAGGLVLYPAKSLHHVAPVTRGVRLASFLWVQSMVRDDGQRALLYDLDQSIQSLAVKLGTGDDEVVRLSGVYHNLVRRWADC